MADVFISYPRLERAKAEPIRDRLEALGLEVFFDIDGIDGGAVFPDVITQKLDASKAVLACWSPLYFTRPWCVTEARIGLSHNRLVPVALAKFSATTPPADLRFVNYFDLTDWRGEAEHENWQRTLRTLERLLGRRLVTTDEPTPTPTPTPTPQAPPKTRKIPDWVKAGAVAAAAVVAIQVGVLLWPDAPVGKPAEVPATTPAQTPISEPPATDPVVETTTPPVPTSFENTPPTATAPPVAPLTAVSDLLAKEREPMIRRLQTALGALGLYTGSADGRAGPGTERAAAAFAQAEQLPAPPALATAPMEVLEQLTTRAEAAVAEASRREVSTWRIAQAADTVAAYRAYLQEFPSGPNAATARTRVAALLQPPPAPRPEPQPAPPPVAASFLDARTTPASTRAPVISVNPASLPDFALFRECEGCPEMVVMPAGSFQMGSPSTEAGRAEDEDGTAGAGGERVSVRVGRFGLSRFETTWAEWEVCVAAGRCTSGRSDSGWGKGRRPVINVDWNDARAYAGYVSGQTRGAYRLPSEAEWEYAARGGTSGAYPWGPNASREHANYGADQCCSGIASGRDQWVNTAPVGQFSPGPFGLFDMHGNVWEWVEDCYRDSLAGQTAAAYSTADCSGRVLRGGSWGSTPQILRSAYRDGYDPAIRDYGVGFRLARTL